MKTWIVPLLAMFLGAGAVSQSPIPRDWKGTNWFPATSVASDSAFAWLPGPINAFSSLDGEFREEVVAAEVARMAASGLNSVRVIPSFWAFVIDRNGYMDSLRKVARICNAHGVRITYMVWSAIGLSTPYLGADGVLSDEVWHDLSGTDPASATCPQLHFAIASRTLQTNIIAQQTGSLPAGEVFFASLYHEPGNELLAQSGDHTQWPFGMSTRVHAYLDAVANFFATDPDGILAFGSYDLFNEPNGGAELYGVPLPNYLQFIRATEDRLLLTHAAAERTIGWAGAGNDIDALELQALAAGYGGTYYSFHSYASVETFGRDMAARKSFADSRGVDAVCSEFHRLDFTAGRLTWLLDGLRAADVGGQMWGFIQNNTFGASFPGSLSPIDGVFQPVPYPGGYLQFQIVNPTDEQGVRTWTSGAPRPPAHTRFVSEPAFTWNGNPEKIETQQTWNLWLESPLIGESVVILVSPLAPGVTPCAPASDPWCALSIGLGLAHLGPATQPWSLGPLPLLGSAPIFTDLSLPPWLSGQAFVLQAIVGLPVANFVQNGAHLTEPLHLLFN